MRRKARQILLAATLLAAMTAVFGCKKEAANDSGGSESAFRVGLVLSTGGLGDKSFNDSAYAGLQRAEKELGVAVKHGQPEQPSQFEEYLKSFAEQDFDLIVGVGVLMADTLKRVAAEFPNSKFAIIDTKVDGPNIASYTFKEHEGSYLAGYLAGSMTESGVVGFVGGMEIPLIMRCALAFEQGAKAVRPDVRAIMRYAGDTPAAFNDAVKGKELALGMYDQGADVVFQAAGATGLGAIDAARERKRYAIGSDANQDEMAPGLVLTSMMKRVDNAVFDIVKRTLDGQFQNDVRELGLKEKGIALTDFAFSRDRIGEKNLSELARVEREIIEGKIDVVDYYDQL